MNCIICNDAHAKLVIKDYPGYIQDTHFDIFYCNICDTSFMDVSKYDNDIYDKIYEITKNNPNSIRGYDRYLYYSRKIKSTQDPFIFLLKEESTYFPIYNYIKSKKNLKILDIGCGLGYLTYAIKEMGHDVLGIDISIEAIESAKNNFGNYYSCIDILKDKTIPDNSLDLIIGTELIEHLPNINEFIQKCKKLLKKNGSMIFTTPNKSSVKSFYKSYWLTDNPPVHTCWMSVTSFKFLAKDFDLGIEVLEEKNYFFKHNLLIPYIFFRYHKSKYLVPSGLGELSSSSNQIFIELIKFISDLPIFYNICNFFYYYIQKENPCLSIRLYKRD